MTSKLDLESSIATALSSPEAARLALIELSRLDCEESLAEFTKQAWEIIEPGTPLAWNWHIDAIAQYIQHFFEGKIKRLILNVPPGSLKSIMFAVMGPAWGWTKRPEDRIISLTNEIGLATRDNRRMRDIVSSDWYQERWPHVLLSHEQNEKTLFANSQKGFRQGLGLTGNITGKRGNCLVGSTIINTQKGNVSIADIHKRFQRGESFSVLSYNHDSQEHVWRDVIATKESYAEDLCEIATIRGSKIRATWEHLVYTGELGYVEAGSLGEGLTLLRADPKDLCRMRRESVKEEHTLLSMLLQGNKACSCSPMRLLREGIRDRFIRLRKISEAWGEEPVLFTRMFPIIPEIIVGKEACLPGVWWKQDEEVEVVRQLRGEEGVKELENFAAERMPGMQRDVPAEIQEEHILRETVREQGSFCSDDRAGEFTFQRRGELCKVVQGNAPTGFAAGRKDVRHMRKVRRWEESFASKLWEMVKSRYTPHQSRAIRQQGGKSDNDVLSVPHDSSPFKEDAVHSVEKNSGKAVKVYDIQIAETRCFFANEILVHNCLLIDDPVDAKKAFSDVTIAEANATYDQAVSSRLNSPVNDRIGLIMQRLRTNDLTGHLLEKKKAKWVHVRIPMEWDGEPGYDPVKDLGPEYAHLADPRTEIGELMFPERFPRSVVEELKEDLGDYGTAGQLQQRPSPLGGGIIKADWWKKWDSDKGLPAPLHVFTSVDTAFSEKDSKDAAYSAYTTWMVFEDDSVVGRKRPALIVIAAWWERVGYPDLRAKIKQHVSEVKGLDRLLIERKASGISLIQDLRRMRRLGVSIRGFNPGKLDKEARAHVASTMFQAGLVYYPDREWARKLIDQVAAFPTGAPPCADLTDTVTQAVIYTKQRMWAQAPDDEDMPYAHQEHSEEWDEDHKQTRKPAYG